RFPTLATGLLTTGIGWGVQGLSVWAMLRAIVPAPPDLTPATWAQCTAGIAFANVAGFVVVVAPGGIGVREYLLSILFSSFGPPPSPPASRPPAATSSCRSTPTFRTTPPRSRAF